MGHGPGVPVEAGLQALGDAARRVFDQAAARNVGCALDQTGLHQRQDRLHIDAGRLHQSLGQGPVAGEGRVIAPCQPGLLDHLADQGIAVGVRTRGGQADDDVACRLTVQIRQGVAALDGAEREARQIIVAALIHAGHLGGLAADEGAAGLTATLRDSGDDALGGVDLELAGGVVVEEQQRLGALGEQVIDAHGDQIDSDPVMASGLDGDLQLGADAVGRSDDQRVLESGRLEVEQGSETPQRSLCAGPAGRFGQRLDGVHQHLAGVDIHPRIGVGHAVAQAVGSVAHRSRA